jgi:hypothetical protein
MFANANLPVTTNDLLVLGGMLAVFVVLSLLVFKRGG